MVLYASVLLFSNLIGAISQVLLKKSASETHKSFIFEYLNFKVIFAYFLFFCAVFIDLFALHFVPVSYVPIIETSSYIFAIILSRIFFKENISLLQLAAVFMIITGIIVYVI